MLKLEAGGFDTSFIKAGGSSAIRAADNCSTVDVSWFTPDIGTVYIEANQVGFIASAGFYSLDNGVANRVIDASFASNRFSGFGSGGMSANGPTGGIPTVGPFHKHATAISIDDCVTFTDGVTGTPDVTVPTSSHPAVL